MGFKEYKTKVRLSLRQKVYKISLPHNLKGDNKGDQHRNPFACLHAYTHAQTLPSSLPPSRTIMKTTSLKTWLWERKSSCRFNHKLALIKDSYWMVKKKNKPQPRNLSWNSHKLKVATEHNIKLYKSSLEKFISTLASKNFSQKVPRNINSYAKSRKSSGKQSPLIRPSEIKDGKNQTFKDVRY